MTNSRKATPLFPFRKQEPVVYWQPSDEQSPLTPPLEQSKNEEEQQHSLSQQKEEKEPKQHTLEQSKNEEKQRHSLSQQKEEKEPKQHNITRLKICSGKRERGEYPWYTRQEGILYLSPHTRERDGQLQIKAATKWSKEYYQSESQAVDPQEDWLLCPSKGLEDFLTCPPGELARDEINERVFVQLTEFVNKQELKAFNKRKGLHPPEEEQKESPPISLGTIEKEYKKKIDNFFGEEMSYYVNEAVTILLNKEVRKSEEKKAQPNLEEEKKMEIDGDATSLPNDFLKWIKLLEQKTPDNNMMSKEDAAKDPGVIEIWNAAVALAKKFEPEHEAAQWMYRIIGTIASVMGAYGASMYTGAAVGAVAGGGVFSVPAAVTGALIGGGLGLFCGYKGIQKAAHYFSPTIALADSFENIVETIATRTTLKRGG